MTQENIPLQPNEEIKPILGYEGLYSITSFGRVWSHGKLRKFGSGKGNYRAKFLKLYLHKSGYLTVGLNVFGKIRRYRVNRLIAQHYILNPQNLPEVNHKDGNKLNNNKDNLEWCTYDHNLKHAMENGLRYKRSSEFHGVSFHRGNSHRIKPWGVNLRDKRILILVGYYKTEIEAALAYNKYIIEHNLNRPLNIL